jgi:hypothetical protein
MEILLPSQDYSDWKEIHQKISNNRPLPPFDATVIKFIQTISNRILRDMSFRVYPELMAMAHWMRRSHLLEIEKHFVEKMGNRVWLPRGTVLHFAPSNVDSIFIYSWFLSMLFGNVNIIRLSQTRGEQITKLLYVINDVLNEEDFINVKDTVLIVSYEHNDSISQLLSANCQVRVIWGGDDSVRKVRSIPLSPNATELVFPNKFSLAAIKSDILLKQTEQEIIKIAMDFYNDSFWFDQMACSSPRLVVWVGERNDNENAKSLFWGLLTEVIRNKGYLPQSNVGITKMVTGYSYAIQGFTDKLSTAETENIYRVHVDTKQLQQDFNIREQHCGGGFFLETEIEELNQLKEIISRKDQTLSVYGFKGDELTNIARGLIGKGLDRIVPIGQALNFNEIWDGYDLMVYFTKEINITIQ